MSTRKIKDAIDLTTNELVYLKGHAKATYMSDGSTVEDAINNINGSGNSYVKPELGIPKTDLDTKVQSSLDKADTALQSYTETYKGTITGITAGSGLTGGGTKTDGATGVTLNVGAGTGITVAADAVSISTDYQNKITSGTTAYGWGNHASAGYAANSALTSHTSSSATTSSLGHVTLVSGDVKSVTYANGKAAAASHTHSQYLTGYTEQYKGTVTGVTINGSTKSPSNGAVNIGNVVTAVTMNGSSKTVSNGSVDLGTVITSHQDISGKQDILTSGANIKTINNNSILGSGNLTINPLLTISSDTSNISKTVSISPNIFYVFTAAQTTQKTFDILNTGTVSNSDNVWGIRFQIGTTVPTINFSSTNYRIIWANGTAPTFEAGVLYEITFKALGTSLLAVCGAFKTV